MLDDATLLHRYAETRSGPDFAELVRRHLDLVYSAALRQVNGDHHLAKDVTQLVFTDLAAKAAQLSRHPVLSGWLFTSTRFAAAKLVRGERRRQSREQEAFLMQEMNSPDAGAHLDWDRVRPVIDAALGELPERDREAVLLRYFEGRNYTAVGRQLSLTENAARMRVDRAMDKLRELLGRRGITSTTAALAAALAGQAVTAAPAGLAATVTTAALAAPVAGATAFASFMSLTKMELGIAAAAAIAGVGTYAVQESRTAGLEQEIAALREETKAVAELQLDNARLARESAEVARLRHDDRELEQLQAEAEAVKERVRQQAARTAEARLRAAPPPPAPPPALPPGDLSKMDRMPRPIAQVAPTYPFELRRAGIPGEVKVSFIVDTTGKVQDARVEEFTHEAFAAPALEAVQKWKFAPGAKGGRLVNTRLNIPIVFQVGDAQGPSIWF